MKKVLKILIVSIFTIGLFIGTILQIDIERYISKQQKEYNVLHERNRIKYTPALFYYLTDRTLNKKSYNIAYYSGDFKSCFSKGIYDEYITECYYTDNEKVNYIIESYIGFPITAELHKDEKFQDFLKNEFHVVIDEIIRYRLPAVSVVKIETKPIIKYPHDNNPIKIPEPLPPGTNICSRDFFNFLISQNKIDSLDAEFMFNSIDSAIILKIDSGLLSKPTISSKKLNNIFNRKDMNAAYDSLQSIYGTSCYIEVGTPIYNVNLTKLILFIDYYCYSLNGQGYVFVLEKKNSKWKIIHTKGTWKS